MAADQGAQLIVDGRAVRVTNLDKVMYPATGTTKGEVIAYYQAIAPWFIPHAARRPATRKRWPNGVGTLQHPQRPFFHKNLDAKSTPEWVSTYTIEHADGPNAYPLIDDAATLVWLAQLAALEIHVPQWRVNQAGEPAHPDRLVLDLDPGEGVGMAECVELAHLLREVLTGAGFASYPVTSGSKGIHLYAALDGSMSSQEATEFARELAGSLAGLRPKLVVADMNKAARKGKVLLDWSQNNAAKTTIAPYSLRGRDQPTVAAPRAWDELTPDVQQLDFREVLERLAETGDLLAGLDGTAPGHGDNDKNRLIELMTEPPVAAGPDEQDAELPVIEPMLASPGQRGDLTGTGWHFEVKWDGYRAIASVADGRASYRSRGGIDLTGSFPELAELGRLLAGRRAVLDGEIVVLDEAGRPSFELLQNHGRAVGRAHFMAFDLLHLDGASLLRQPYLSRRAGLRDLLGEGGQHIHLPDDLGTDVDVALAVSAAQGLEGVVAKRADSVYQPGRRARTWVKLKHVRTQDVVIIGWAPGENARARTIGSVLVAVPNGDELAYIGRVGSGFTEKGLAEARTILGEIETAEPAAPNVPGPDAAGVHWVEPLLVGEVSYGEFTASGRLRHPVWRGWRPDRLPDDVVWEGPQRGLGR